MSSDVCPYTSPVIAIEEWPSTSATALMWMPDSSHDTAPAVAQRVNAGRSRSGFGCRELDGRSTLRGSISRALYAVPGTGPLATGPTRLGPGQRPVAGVESVAVSACANRELMTELPTMGHAASK